MLLVVSEPPYLTNYTYFNASLHTVSTARCNDIRIPKVNLVVAKDPYKVLVRWNLTVFLVILKQRNSSLNAQGKLKTFSLFR